MLVPGTVVAPLFVQFPVTFTVVPEVNVPDDNKTEEVAELFTFNVAHAVKLPVVSVKLFTVNVAVLPPTDKVVPAVFATTTL